MLSLISAGAIALAVCVPSPGFDETIVDSPYVAGVPAVGEPTLQIPNSDYKPGTPDVPAVGTPTIVIPNPDYIAEVLEQSHVVHHAEIGHDEYKYVEHGGNDVITLLSNEWKYWTSEGVGTNEKPKSGTFYERTNSSRYIVDEEAWDETVIDVEASPAVGEPTLTVENPDYVPAIPGTPSEGEEFLTVDNPDYVPAVPEIPEVSHVVRHDAVVCELPPVAVTPADVPVVQETVRTDEVAVVEESSGETLAQTGGGFNPWALGAAGLLLAGGATLLIRRRA